MYWEETKDNESFISEAKEDFYYIYLTENRKENKRKFVEFFENK